MPEPIVINGKKFITSKQAAALTGYARDYVGQLVRMGKVKGQVIDKTLFVSEESLLAHVESKNANSKVVENSFKNAIAENVAKAAQPTVAPRTEAFVAFPKLTKIVAKPVSVKTPKLVSKFKTTKPSVPAVVARIAPYADAIGKISSYAIKHAIGVVAILTLLTTSYASIKSPDTFLKDLSSTFSFSAEAQAKENTSSVIVSFNSFAKKINSDVNNFLGIGVSGTTIVQLAPKVKVATTTVVREVVRDIGTTTVIRYTGAPATSIVVDNSKEIDVLVAEVNNLKNYQQSQLEGIFRSISRGRSSGATTNTTVVNNNAEGTTTLTNLTVTNSSTSTIPNLDVTSSFTLNGDTIVDFVGAGLDLTNGVLSATAGAGFSTTSANYHFDSRLAATTTLNNLTTLRGLTDLITTNATTTTFALGSDYITDLTGTGLSVVNGALTVSGATGFSTTSTDYWETAQTRWATTSDSYAFDTRLAATTTLPNLTTLLGLTDSITTRATTTNATSTNLAVTNLLIGSDLVADITGDNLSIVNGALTVTLDGAFSTTSADYWETVQTRWATTSDSYAFDTRLAATTTLNNLTTLQGLTSLIATNATTTTFAIGSDYITDITGANLSVVNGALTVTLDGAFSTTSADYWDTTKARWSTTTDSLAFDARLAASTSIPTIGSLTGLATIGSSTGTTTVAGGTIFGAGIQIGSDYITDITGGNLLIVNGALTATDLTFSTTSADYWDTTKARWSTTTDSLAFDARLAATTSLANLTTIGTQTNFTFTNATGSNLYITSLDCSLFLNGGKLTTDSSGRVSCANDSTGSGGGGGGTDVNWTYFNGSGISVSTTSNQVVIGASATSSLQKLQVSGGAYFTGTVGIGTSSPTEAFSVNGSTLIAGLVRASTFNATSTTATSTFPNLSLTNLIIGSDFVSDITGTGLSIVNGALTASGDGAFSTTSADYWDTTKARWSTTTDSLAFDARLAASTSIPTIGSLTGLVTIGSTTGTTNLLGNVGIGTTTPYQRLSVNGSAVVNGSVLASIFTATSTTATSTFPLLSSTAFALGSDYVTDLTGSNLSIVNGALTVTLDGAFSTTSADYWDTTKARWSTTTDSLAFDARLAATTSLPNLAILRGLTDVISTRATTTNATSTNFFATIASSTNLYTSKLSVATTSQQGAITVQVTGAESALFLGRTGTANNLAVTFEAGRTNFKSPSGFFNLTNAFSVNQVKQGLITVGSYDDVTYAPRCFGGAQDTGTIGPVFIGGGFVECLAATTIDFYASENASTTVGSLAMRILGGGNVGIGTTSPYQKLSVNGSAVVNGNVLASTFTATSTTATSTFPNLSLTNIRIGSDYLTDITGANLSIVNGALTATDLTFSTTSADYWDTTKARWSTTTDSLAFDARLAASTSIPTIGSLTGLATIGSSSALTTVLGNINVQGVAAINGATIASNTGLVVQGAADAGTGAYAVRGNAAGSNTTFGILGYDDSSSCSSACNVAGIYAQAAAGHAIYTAASGSATGGYFTAAAGNALEAYSTDGYGLSVSSVNSRGLSVTGSTYSVYAAGGQNYFEGNVGVGTTTPYAKLSVNGRGVFDQDVRANYFTATSTTATSTLPKIESTLINSGKITINGNSNANDNLIILNGGDDFERAISFNEGEFQDGYVSFDHNSAQLKLWNKEHSGITGDILFGTNNTEKFRMTYNGNFGIGTSTPYARLSVAGQAVAEYFTATSTTATSTFPKLTSTYLNVGNDTVNDLTGTGILNVGGALTLDTSAAGLWATTSDTWNFGVLLSATSSLSRLNVLSGLSTVGSTTGTTTFLGDTVFNTFVNIGTTSDYAKLNITATAGSNYREAFMRTSISDSGKTQLLMYNGTSVNNLYVPAIGGFQEDSTRPSVQLSGLITPENDASDSSIYGVVDMLAMRVASSSDPINSATSQIQNRKLFTWRTHNAVESIFLMTMTANGNLGIGTTSPYAKLSVVGETVSEYFTATSTTATSTFPKITSTYLKVGNDTVNDLTGTGILNVGGALTVDSANIVGSGTLGQVPYFASAGSALTATSSLYIASTSWIGMGTSVPQAGLHVVVQNKTGFRENFMKFGTTDAGNDAGYLTNGSLVNSNFMATLSGYTDSSATLGSVQLKGMTSAANDASDSASIGIIDLLSVIAADPIDPNNGNYSSVTNRKLLTVRGGTGTTGDLKFVISANGNVGIGTTTPYARLAVSGQTVSEYFTATSTTATSTFPLLSTNALSLNGQYVTSFWSTTTDSLAFDERLAASTSIPTIGSLTGLVTIGSSTGITNLLGNIGISSSSPSARFAIDTTGLIPGQNILNIGSSTRQDLLLSHTGSLAFGTSTTNRAKIEITNYDAIPTLNIDGSDAGADVFRMYRSNANGGTGGYGMALKIQTSKPSFVFRSAMSSNSEGNIVNAITSDDLIVGGLIISTSTAVTLTNTGIEPFYLKNSTSNIGLAGTSTPWGSVSINGAYQSVGEPTFVVGSSTKTDFIIDQAGNIGIGTITTATSKVSIQGKGISTGANLQLYDNDGVPTFSVLDNGSVGFGSSTGLTTFIDPSVMANTVARTMRFRNNTTSAVEGFQFWNGNTNTNLLMIQQNGNVGVGTTSPISKFSVSGDTWISGTATSSTYNATSTTVASILPLLISTNATSTNLFATVASTTDIFSGGNISIGTSTGNSRLEIFHTGSNPALSIDAGVSGNDIFRIYRGGSSAGVGNGMVLTAPSNSPQFIFRTGMSSQAVGTSRNTISYDLGLASLVISTSSITAGATGLEPIIVRNTSSNVGLAGTSTPWGSVSINGVKQEVGEPTFVIGSSTKTDLIVTQAGAVGVATTSSWTKFAVNGKVAMQGLTAAAGTPNSVCMNSVTKEITENAATSCITSDRDQKQQIQDLTISGLDTIRNIKPVTFAYNDFPDRNRIGFIAQDMQAVDDRLGDAFDKKGIARSIDIPAIMSVTVKAVQELDVKVNKQASTTADQFLAVIGTKPSSADNFLINGDLTFKNKFSVKAEDGANKYLNINSSTGANVITFTENGNIGIGTTGPTYKLQVIGDVAATAFVNISTIESKTDIKYLSDEKKDTILETLNKMKIAQYRYKSEDKQNPLRLGLIAEEAPSEVLSVGGKGVDIYKLSTFTLAAVQAQQKQIQSIDTRLTALEAKVASSTMATTSESMLASLISGIKSLFLDELTVGSKDKATGITLFDEETGKPYCIKVSGGNMKSTAGACGETPKEEVKVDPKPVETTQTPTPAETNATSTATTTAPTVPAPVVQASSTPATNSSSTSAPAPEAPKEEPKTEAPKVEEKAPEATSVPTPAPEAPKTEAPKPAEAPKEEPKTEAPKVEEKAPEAPKEESKPAESSPSVDSSN